MSAPTLGAAHALALAALGGCASYTPSALEAWPDEPSCGTWENLNEPVSAAQREGNRCLLEAFAAGRPAELFYTYVTIEGDSIHAYVRVLGPDRVEWLVDATGDSYGKQVWRHTLCRGVYDDGGRLSGEDCRALPLDEQIQ
jgi:hypothetical protein